LINRFDIIYLVNFNIFCKRNCNLISLLLCIMRYLLCTLTILLSLVQPYNAVAQHKKKTNQNTKTTFPSLKTYLGKYSDTVTLSPAEVAKLIESPLKVVDVNNKPAAITFYQVLYSKIDFAEDENTGKVNINHNSVSNFFKTTPLPSLWIETIKLEVKPGEELYFFDVIVKDAEGRNRYAPELKIKVR
jgi:hypothetical protein